MKIDFGLVVFCIYPTIFDYVLVFNAFILCNFYVRKKILNFQEMWLSSCHTLDLLD